MPFTPGQSGNPSGRPKGIADKRTELRALLDLHSAAIIKKLIECAKAGDPAALKLCIERLIPRVKPNNGIHFELPEGRIDTGDNMLKIANTITEVVANGQMTIEEAEKLKDFLKNQRWILAEAEQKQQQEVRDAEWKKRFSSSSSITNT